MSNKDIELNLRKLESENKEEFQKLLQQYVDIQGVKDRNVQIRALNEAQQKALTVEHYKLHLPPTATAEQLQFIKNIAQCVIRNDPVVVAHEKAMQFLLRMAYMYRNILQEFDEEGRWSEEDERSLQKISREFQPILDWLVENYKLQVSKFRWK